MADDDYVAWKGWGRADFFGTLGRGDANYYLTELREARRSGEIRDVLEIGYGDGHFLAFARQQGWSVVGTELLPELLDAARLAGFDVRHARSLDRLPPAAFDLVVAFDVFEHVPPDQSLAFLGSLRRALRVGGTLVLRFPNADSWAGNAFQNGDPTHVNAIGYLKLRYYSVAADLDLVAFRPVSRRGFSTSLVHGLHRWTGGVLARVIAGVAKAVFLPGLPVVLSSGNVIAVLRRSDSKDQGATAR